MAGAARKWFIGCGIGCGLLIVILGGLGTCAYYAFRDIGQDAKEINASNDAMVEQFGRPQDFAPDADGAIPAARVEIFLAARDTTAADRLGLRETIRLLDGDRKGDVFAKIKAGMGFVPSMMAFVGHRNDVLLDAGMGDGEYAYIYVMACYGLLGKDLADGPSFDFIKDDDSNGFHWQGRGHDGERSRRNRVDALRKVINRLMLSHLTHQLAALDSTSSDDLTRAGVDAAAWRTQLTAEVDALAADARRLPWQDGLPDRLQRSLEPFRDRLDRSYDPWTSALEASLMGGD